MYINLHRCRATTQDSECGSAQPLSVQLPIWWEGKSGTEHGQEISGGEPTPGRQRGSKSTELLSHLSSFRTQHKDKIFKDFKVMTAGFHPGSASHQLYAYSWTSYSFSLCITFSIGETRVIIIIYLLESLCRLHELLYGKYIVHGMAHLNKHYKNSHYHYFSSESTLQVPEDSIQEVSYSQPRNQLCFLVPGFISTLRFYPFQLSDSIPALT